MPHGATESEDSYLLAESAPGYGYLPWVLTGHDGELSTMIMYFWLMVFGYFTCNRAISSTRPRSRATSWRSAWRCASIRAYLDFGARILELIRLT